MLAWITWHLRLAKSRYSGDVDGAGGFAVEERLGEFDNVCLGDSEDGLKRVEEVVIGRVVGPEGKDAVWLEMRGEGAQR
jgi:hypothetical protein